MERPDTATVSWYEAALPPDPRAVRGQMFGHPCAFVQGNMFFGTFAQSVVARVGEARGGELARRGPARVFEPMPGRAWKEYVQVDRGAVPATTLAGWAREALEYTAALPPKGARRSASTPARDGGSVVPARPRTTSAPPADARPGRARPARARSGNAGAATPRQAAGTPAPVKARARKG